MINACINGIECKLFYDERISVNKAPAGYPYMYHLRHDEENWNRPISIENFVFVNFFGTIFTNKPLNIDRNDYIDVNSFEMDWEYVEFRFPIGLFCKSPISYK